MDCLSLPQISVGFCSNNGSEFSCNKNLNFKFAGLSIRVWIIRLYVYVVDIHGKLERSRRLFEKV